MCLNHTSSENYISHNACVNVPFTTQKHAGQVNLILSEFDYNVNGGGGAAVSLGIDYIYVIHFWHFDQFMNLLIIV